jgi:hypothetical protein
MPRWPAKKAGRPAKVAQEVEAAAVPAAPLWKLHEMLCLLPEGHAVLVTRKGDKFFADLEV